MYCNAAKGVNTSTEFKEYKSVLFNKKINKIQNEKNSKQTT